MFPHPITMKFSKLFLNASEKPVVSRETALNYKREDFAGLRRSLELFLWNIMGDMTMDDAVDLFYDVLNAAICDHIPTVVLRRKFPPRFDGEVKRALRDKEAAFNRRKHNRNVDTEREFHSKRRDFKRCV